MSGVCAEHLSTPGQWYHDRAGAQVLYYPLPGEDMAKATAVLAVEEVLVSHVGLSQVILPPAPGVSNEGGSSPLLALAPLFLGPGFQLGAR